jgi:hypothetical protein
MIRSLEVAARCLGTIFPNIFFPTVRWRAVDCKNLMMGAMPSLPRRRHVFVGYVPKKLREDSAFPHQQNIDKPLDDGRRCAFLNGLSDANGISALFSGQM